MLGHIIKLMSIALLILWAPFSAAKDVNVEATDYRLSFSGRVVKDWTNSDVYFNWPGVALSFRFKGMDASIIMNGRGGRFDVLVNGRVVSIINTDSTLKKYPLVKFDSQQDVLVELVKRNETYEEMVFFDGLEVNGEVLEHRPSQKHIIFFGDSLSAGLGSESHHQKCSSDETFKTSNARVAFPTMTAKLLNASHSQVSYSGLGVIRNYAGEQRYHNLPYYFNKAGAVLNDSSAYEDRHPGLLVIELGLNDFNTDLKPDEPWANVENFRHSWTDAYVQFIIQLRQRYGDVPIVLVGLALDKDDPFELAINAVNEELLRMGERSVYIKKIDIKFDGCLWHPTEVEHKRISTILASFISDMSLLSE
ncbi:MAG: GDSL-type esterase/lipase family protein [Aeromonas sp.]